MSTTSIANLCRTIVARHLRTRKDLLDTEFIIAGCEDSFEKSVLFWLDNIGSIREVPYCAHGNQFSSILSFFDRYYDTTSHKVNKSDSSDDNYAVQSGLLLLKNCWLNVKKRSSTKIGKIRTKCVTSTGILIDLGIDDV